MLVLGLLLILLAVGLFLGFLAAGTQEVSFESGILDVTVNSLTVYLLGALTLLLLVAGLALLRVGTRRASQRRAERKELGRLSAKLEAQEAGAGRDGDTTEARAGRGDTGTVAAATTDATPETAPQSTTVTPSESPTGTTTSSTPTTAETPAQARDDDLPPREGGTTRG